jgi:polyketide biosynthesis enoyl-CoA hydratase PksH
MGVIPMSWNTLQVERQAAAIRIRIHRPAANNSINAELTDELGAVLREAEEDERVRVVVLEGNASAFCTGLDFEEFVRGTADGEGVFERDALAYYDVLKAMVESPKVILALVAGKVNAGGVGFVAAADLVIAGPGASFALSELLFGLLPACVLPFLIRRVGFQKAQQLALTTQAIDAGEAYRWGLVDECAEDPEQALRRRLPRMARLAPEAVGRLKGYMNELWCVSDKTRQLAVGTISGLLARPETQAKIQRFVREGAFPWQT